MAISDKKEYGINEYREELESQLFEAQLNADSPYNDGWTQEGARKKVAELKEKLKKVGKQLKLDL
jgi:hypothetical protein